MKPAVLNASPLIVLARAGYLDLVRKLASSAVVPRAVATEVTAGPAEDPTVRFLARPSWLTVVDLTPPLSPLQFGDWDKGRARCLSTPEGTPVPLPCWMTGQRDGRRLLFTFRLLGLWVC